MLNKILSTSLNILSDSLNILSDKNLKRTSFQSENFTQPRL